ncbi:GNAT family N-acetyltransferase [Demequina sp.]|uniref:GNAT family N-acetyltransferase n=1 Tax=Demequina sp. TaxID=2050685 RepID=UPI003A8C5CB5
MPATPRAVSDAAEVRALHEALLAPHFPPAELVTPDSLAAAVTHGRAQVLVIEEDGPVAMAVGEFAGTVALLAYLVVDSRARAGGYGSRLLDAAVHQWLSPEAQATCLLAEIESPTTAVHHPAHGDPARRAAFYAKQGARMLDVPYFQPALNGDGQRVSDMLLLLIASHAPAGADDRLHAGGALVAWMEAYLLGTEGAVNADDAQAQALLTALADPDGIPLLPVPIAQ